MLHPSSPNWQPPVMMLSALKAEGLTEFWAAVERFKTTLSASGEFVARRNHQALAWMWARIDQGLRHGFREHPAVRSRLPELAAEVEAGKVPPTVAADQLLELARG
jgi:LAO/AO transport system kinase